MKNYEIKKNGEVYDLMETRTEQVIGTYSDVLKAQVAKTHFNRGGGFDGWTPSFFLKNKFDLSRKKS